MRAIIDFRDEMSEQQMFDFMFDNRIRLVKSFNSFKNAKVVLVPDGFDPRAHEEIEDFIQDDEPIELQSYETMEVSTTDKDQWWINAVSSPTNVKNDKWTLRETGRGTVVYMVDSGWDKSHPEFVGSDVRELWSFNGSFDDTTGHGTALTSVLVGKTCGVTNCTVKQVKVFDSSVKTTVSDIIHSLDVVLTDHLANDPGTTKIVNCSWNTAANDYLDGKVLTLTQSGLAVVCSAGNAGGDVSDYSPGRMLEVITVGSFGPSMVPSDFSNVPSILKTSKFGVNAGEELDVWCPGEAILVAAVGGSKGHISGTSISAAIASAVFAARLDMYPSGGLAGRDDILQFVISNRLTLDGKYAGLKNYIPLLAGELKYPKLPCLVTGIMGPFIFDVEVEYHVIGVDLYNITSLVVTGLPSGLMLNSTTGKIHGKIQAPSDPSQTAVDIPIMVSATNSFGTSSGKTSLIAFTEEEYERLVTEPGDAAAIVNPQCIPITYCGPSSTNIRCCQRDAKNHSCCVDAVCVPQVCP